MAIVPQMRDRLKESMKARDTTQTNFLRYWIAQLTTGTGEEVPDDQAIKKMRAMLKEARGGQTSFSPEEVALLEQWVPPTLGRSQIEQELSPAAEQIKAAPKQGQAMGIAMKTLGGKPVEADDVKAVVAEMRGES